MIRAITFNLGCASPSAVSAQRRDAAYDWARGARDSNDLSLLFLQEVPDGRFLDEFTDAVWGVATGDGPTYRVRSAVLWKRDELRGSQIALDTADYHGSYVAAAKLTRGGGTAFTAVSFHASPSPVVPEYRDAWTRLGLDLPTARDGGGPSSGQLWDSDMVIATLKMAAAAGPVLAAGDLNECLLWDKVHGGTWGTLIRERATAAPQALRFALHDLWHGERRTLFKAGEPEYQLDHVLATPDLSAQVRAAEVDAEWSERLVAGGSQSDHAPIRFSLELAG
jgi:endonuclease/exonuclease/phosphatase family metal-dependent hydrolase